MWYSIRAKIRTRNDFAGGARLLVPAKYDLCGGLQIKPEVT